MLEVFPNVQFVVTTHSPLVLAQLNSLLYRNMEDIRVFNMTSGTIDSLQDQETGLIVSSEMDKVANEVDAEFEALLNGRRE